VVDNNPEVSFLLLIFIWILFWEIGGQNVPADWNDTVEDQRVGAKTIPIHFGFQKAGQVVLAMLGLTLITSLFLPTISPLPLGLPYMIATATAGLFLLLQPAYQLYRNQQEGRLAARLFDKASYYPLAQLAIISLFAIIS
jgi:4-hydroxybenzoate polyprenyltransferase